MLIPPWIVRERLDQSILSLSFLFYSSDCKSGICTLVCKQVDIVPLLPFGGIPFSFPFLSFFFFPLLCISFIFELSFCVFTCISSCFISRRVTVAFHFISLLLFFLRATVVFPFQVFSSIWSVYYSTNGRFSQGSL